MKQKWSDKKTIFVRFAAAAALAVLYAAFAHAQSAGLDVTHTSVPVAGLPAGLGGLRIAEVADLHSSWYGADQSGLVQPIADFKPDFIAVTGDFIDGAHPDTAPCEALMRSLSAIAPVYFVPGNNEYYIGADRLAAFEADMQACGAHILVNGSAVFEKSGVQCLVSGIDDTMRFTRDPEAKSEGPEQYAMEKAEGFMAQIGQSAPAGEYPFKIMLSHEPQYWQLWNEAGYGLALCGHLHGWVFRLPGVGGVLRKPSVYFPEEDAGLYDKQGTMVYISRGLDNLNVLDNFRMNNKPELALIEVERKN